jgi:hypothetical protein
MGITHVLAKEMSFFSYHGVEPIFLAEYYTFSFIRIKCIQITLVFA